MSDNACHVKVRDLTVSIGAELILDRLGFDIQKGEILGFSGPSGSGKSMLALALIGLLPAPASVRGEIILGGQNLVGLGEKSLQKLRGREIAMIFQEPMTALNPLHTIGQQIGEAVVQSKPLSPSFSPAMCHQDVRALMAQVELDPEHTSPGLYPHQLSGGQRQRVVIAIAIAQQPGLLIADEPTTALDMITQAEILRLLKKITKHHDMALILITHDEGVLREYSDRVVSLKAGRLAGAGSGEGEQNICAPAARAQSSPRKGVPVLVARDVCAGYPAPRRHLFARPIDRPVLDRISFTLAPGEVLGIAGPSGCGKSTLLRCLTGLHALSAGDISVGDISVREGRKTHQRRYHRAIQMVFQDPYGSFNPRRRVSSLLAEPLFLIDQQRRRADHGALVAKALIRVGLEPAMADRYPHEFSGGQRQRLAIARALMIEPDVVLLDEAVSALDRANRDSVLALVRTLAREDGAREDGVAFVFVSHDLSVMRSLCDHIMIMAEGRIVEAGPPGTLFANPAHATTRALIAAIPGR